MQEKDRLRSIVKNMSDMEALDFIDKYKDYKKKPKNIMARRYDKAKHIKHIVIKNLQLLIDKVKK
ncbi:MAG: hypothetical protein HQ579_03885 [Candidatus Omnitrophica bacterium]|nr:hypothetical protein [Candidatus Omnitrophota bacterium]